MNLIIGLSLKDFFRNKAFFLFCSLYFLINISLSQNQYFEFDSIHQSIYHEGIQLKTISAKKQISTLKEQHPNNLATLFVEEVADFYAVIALSSKDAFYLYKSKNSDRISVFENSEIKSPYIKFCLAELYLHRAICRVLFNEKIKSVFDIKKARNYAIKNAVEYPLFQLNDKPKSILNILLGSIPPSIKWASETISLKGDYNTGITELNRLLNYTYTNEDHFCFFFEILTYKILISQQSIATKADKKILSSYLNTLSVKKEQNINYLLLYSIGDYYIKNSQSNKAISAFNNMQKSEDYIPFWPIEFIWGVALQNNLDNECTQHFNTYIAGVKTGNYVNAAYQRLAWQCILNQNQQGYSKFISQINKINSISTEQDLSAYFEQQSKQQPQLELLRARLLFDGGNYLQSQEELKKINVNKLGQKIAQLEYYYRLARVLEKLQNSTQAIYLYNKVIIDGSNIENYYAANAALNAGNICETLNEKSKATFYYKKCLSLSPNQYKESIHQKAKIGIERLKQ